MNEYTLVASAVLLGVAILAGIRGAFGRPRFWIGMVIFALLTIVADVALTRIGVYRHRPAFNAGILIDQMPIEDLLYGIALYLVAVVSWTWPPRQPHGE